MSNGQSFDRRIFLTGGVGGLVGGAIAGLVQSLLGGAVIRGARPPIIIKGSSLEVWCRDANHDLEQQSNRKLYYVDGGGSLSMLVTGFSGVPDLDVRKIKKVVLERAGAVIALKVEVNMTEDRVEYTAEKELTRNGRRHFHPDNPAIVKLTAWKMNDEVVGPYAASQLKFHMELS